MLRRYQFLLIAALAAFAAATPGFAAGPLFPPGSRIGLEPPRGLVMSRRFNGFEDRARDVAITMLDLPEPAYQALEKSAFKNAVKGLIIEKRELFPFHAGIGYLVTGHEVKNGTTFRNWYLLANVVDNEAGHVAALIAVHMPGNATRDYPDRVVRAALASVSFRKPPLAELLGLLPYKLKTMAGFHVAKVSPPGVVVLIDGAGDNPAHQPYLVVSIGRGAPAAAELRPKFARDLMTTVPLSNVVLTSGEAMRIANMPGYEVRATAEGAGGRPLALVQWLRFAGAGNFIRVIGIVGKDRWDALFPRFRAVRDGVDIRK